MRIGFDSKRLYCNFTGLGNYSRSLVKNLLHYFSDEEYHLYTTRLKITPETTYFIDNPYYRTYLTKSIIKPYWRTYSIVNQLKKDGIELYHGLSNEIPINLKRAKIKSIVTIHDLIFKVLPNTYSIIDRKIYDYKFRYSCLNADRIIAVSNNTKNDIIKYYDIEPNRIDVIYQSCNPLFYEPLNNTENKIVLQKYDIPNEYFLFVGSIEERKNLNLIIEAYQYLPSDYQIPLVIIGNGGKYTKQIKYLVWKNGLENKVLWYTNLIDNYHLRIIYQNSMAVIYPSMYEGFGLPVLEALMSKTPVITSNNSSLTEVGGPHSLAIDPNCSEELADAICKILSNSELRNTMIKKGYEYASRLFSPNKVTNQLLKYYKETLNDK